MFAFVLLALAGAEVARDWAEVNSTAAALKRLAASARMPNPGEDARAAAWRAELDALVKFTDRFAATAAKRELTQNESYNYLQVVRDTIDTGTWLCRLPEERLCWLRVGLSFADANISTLR